MQVQSRFLERTADGHFLFRSEKADSTILGYFTDEGRSVKWRPKDGARKPDHVEVGVLTRPETICRAEVSSLSPGTLWYWRIAAKGKVLSPVGSFKTAADPDKAPTASRTKKLQDLLLFFQICFLITARYSGISNGSAVRFFL